MNDSSKIAWASGEAYEPFVGRWSRLVATEFLSWLAVPSGCTWLDVGCGTGALSQTILDLAEPKKICGIDPSEGFVSYARAQVNDARVKFDIGNAMSLPRESERFDAVVSGLVLNFVPDPAKALSEMSRISRPGGTVAVYVWDYAGEMQLVRHFWDAAVTLDPRALEHDEGRRSPICKAEPLTSLFQSAGLKNVETKAIDVPTTFKNFDDYWSPFLGGQGPAPGYAMSLSEEKRVQLRELIRKRLPIEPDGSIHLVARAWAIRGQR